MARPKEMWLTLLDDMEAAGKTGRRAPDPIPDDAALVMLARVVASRRVIENLLDRVDKETIIDLRDAYDQGRQPRLLDFDQVLDELHKLDVPACILHTSGGTGTLYAGEPDPDRYEEDDRCYYPVSMGPGDFEADENRHTTGDLDDITAGTTRHDEGVFDMEYGAMPADVAAAIATLVAEEQG